jgi:MoxR-like ATPase
MNDFNFDQIRAEIEDLRQRINHLRRTLSGYFVGKEELIDVMTVCTAAQEPLLIVGPPGTAKSDLVVKFAQALGLDADRGEYFEYMLTKFTEPGELIGPLDIQELKAGRHVRRVQGKMPLADIVFLDEIFKSNSAILNTLLTIINERKYYQDGRPEPVNLKMLFAATNAIPDFDELAALRDRFVLKIESQSVRDAHFDELIEKGLLNETRRAFGQRPWENQARLEDFLKVKYYLDYTISGQAGTSVPLRARGEEHPLVRDRARYFKDDVYRLFQRILRTLEREDHVEISDRQVIKLYKLLRTRALLFHGGEVTKEDLVLLRYVGDRTEDLPLVRDKVDALLRLTD